MTTTIKGIADLFAKVGELELKDFEGNPVGVTLKLVGTDSKQYRDAEKKMLPYAGKMLADLTPSEIEAIALLRKRTVIAFIVGWDNNDVMGGAYSADLADELFIKDEAKIVLDQVEEFAQERANFFRPSKK